MQVSIAEVTLDSPLPLQGCSHMTGTSEVTYNDQLHLLKPLTLPHTSRESISSSFLATILVLSYSYSALRMDRLVQARVPAWRIDCATNRSSAEGRLA